MERKQEKSAVRKQKIIRTSIVDQICMSMKEHIVKGVWKEGEKLPSEGELADIFGVNRLSVRMALQKLSTLGLIETRVGEGSFVKPFSLGPFLSEIAVFYEDEEKYNEVRQLRNLLEGECMNLAILYATDEEKEELYQRLNQYNEQVRLYDGDNENSELLNQVVEADLRFHYQVIKMSHNSLYKDIYYMVWQLVRHHIAHMISTRTRPDNTHDRIYEGIIHGDPKAVRQAREEILGMIPLSDMEDF